MQRETLVLDIETVPDPMVYDHPEPSAQGPRPFPPLYAHRPIAVGAMLLDRSLRLRRLWLIGEGRDEQGILEDFSSFVTEHSPAIVTYNGRNFDLPVLALRALRHGIPMPWYCRGDLVYRDEPGSRGEDPPGHVDLSDAFLTQGSPRALRLDALARLIGLPGKLGIDGSMVEDFYRQGREAEIQRYCLADVTQTALLYLRVRLLDGSLSPASYQEIVTDLVADLRGDERVADLLQAIDDARLSAAAA